MFLRRLASLRSQPTGDVLSFQQQPTCIAGLGLGELERPKLEKHRQTRLGWWRSLWDQKFSWKPVQYVHVLSLLEQPTIDPTVGLRMFLHRGGILLRVAGVGHGIHPVWVGAIKR